MSNVDDLARKFARDIEMTKAQILKARRYRKRREILSRILEEGAAYTFSVVDRLLMEYLKKRVGV